MYDLTEDQLIMMEFLSGKGRTPKEFTDFRPHNKFWNQHMATQLFLQLADADFLDNSDNTIMRLNSIGEAYLRGYKRQQRRLKRQSFIDRNKLLFTALGFLIGSVVTPVSLEVWKTYYLQSPQQPNIQKSVADTTIRKHP